MLKKLKVLGGSFALSLLSVVALSSVLALSSCASLKTKLSAYRAKKGVRVTSLPGMQLTERPGFFIHGSMAFGPRYIRYPGPWQWRKNDALGAPMQSFITPQFVGGEDVLVPTLGGGIGLLNLRWGFYRWMLPVAIGVASQPVVVGSSVIVAGMDALVHKIKLSNGEIEWTSAISAESLGGAVESKGFVYVTTGDDALWALDEKTGNSLWTYKRPSPESSVYWSLRGNAIPAVSPDGSKIYLGFSDGTFVCLEATSGQTVWERKFERTGRFKDADTSPVLSADGSTVYVSILDGDFVALKTSDGSTLWALPGGSATAPDLDEKAGAIYYSTGDSLVQKVSLKDATIQWSRSLKNQGLPSTPVRIGENHLAVTTSHGGIVILDRHNGEIVWEKSLGYGSLAAPAFDGRRLVVISARNYLVIHRVDEIKTKN